MIIWIFPTKIQYCSDLKILDETYFDICDELIF